MDPGRMKVLTVVLLVLLLLGLPVELHRLRREQVLDLTEDEDDVDPGLEGYDDDDESEEEEAASSRALLQCYSCQSLHRQEGCSLQQNCSSRQAFCKALISHSETGSGPLTTYSAWCSDTCQPVTRTVERTLMTIICCQSTLCNTPPWQDPPGSEAGKPGERGAVFQDSKVGSPQDRGQGVSLSGDSGRPWSRGAESSQGVESGGSRGRGADPQGGKVGGDSGSGAGAPQGSLLAVTMAFVSSLLFGLWFLGS
ncbi:glycosylphosphatidylinositol-anchored high density lipoprotein-binding protein 1 isoform X2 [Erinaceus europaeus]|uniref:Glycosylphosphatidylinositol-anchored high density lipoprotein-binding protein 1 isoform X2 n=1 Tax=Erinaceus europaeus TaxID=9365 RepID=A0A1S3AHD4_ERIEU|nr:glycosylphosphatidylinositol-anchored high density lipoprotein-binding protein 1 isoform X2 [Erinaceus europaeus]